MAFTKIGQSTFNCAAGASTENKTLPGPPAADDIVIICCVAGNAINTASNEGPQGYTNLHTSTGASPGRIISYKVMTATPDTIVTVGQEATSKIAGVIQVWRGQDLVTPIDNGIDTAASGASGLPDPAARATVTANALVFAVGFLDDDDAATGITAPTNYTDLIAGDTGQGLTTLGSTVMMASRLIASASSEDPGAFTGGTGTDAWIACNFALRQGAAAAGHPAMRRIAALPRMYGVQGVQVR